MEFEGSITPVELMERLNQVLPRGIKITGAAETPLSAPPSQLERSVYWILLDHLLPKEEVITSIEKSMEKREILVHQERKGRFRQVDIRPLIEKMDVKDKNSSCGVELVLRKKEGRTAKPTEIVAAILGLEEERLANLKIVKIK
jgi:radical SAM-linked protein